VIGDENADMPFHTESIDEPVVELDRTDDSTSSPHENAATSAGGRGRALVNAVLVLVTLIAILGVGLMIRTTLNDSRDENRTHDAVAAAEQLVLAVTSVTVAELEKDIEAVLALSTGDFKDQFAAQKSAYLDAVTKAKVSSTGKIDEVGVFSSSPDQVVVLIAASATITNPKATQGDRRVYRMKVTEVRRGGKWLTSNLELVA